MGIILISQRPVIPILLLFNFLFSCLFVTYISPAICPSVAASGNRKELIRKGGNARGAGKESRKERAEMRKKEGIRPQKTQ